MSSFTVPPGLMPLRLDVFLTRTLPHCSRRTAQAIIGAGAARYPPPFVRTTRGTSMVAPTTHQATCHELRAWRKRSAAPRQTVPARRVSKRGSSANAGPRRTTGSRPFGGAAMVMKPTSA